MTGHAEKSLDVNWNALAQLNHTIVFYMGLTRAPEISQQLLAGALAADTPVAIIENGCRKNQRNIITDLSDFPAAVLREQVQSPALIIVGHVVSLSAVLGNAVLGTQQLNSEYWSAFAADVNQQLLSA